MPPPRSDPYGQLQRLMRLEDVDDEVGAHVIANLAVLAPVLGVPVERLATALGEAQKQAERRRGRRFREGPSRANRGRRESC